MHEFFKNVNRVNLNVLLELLNVHSESERYLSVFSNSERCFLFTSMSVCSVFVFCSNQVQTVCWPIFGKIMGAEAKIRSHCQRGVSNSEMQVPSSNV